MPAPRVLRPSMAAAGYRTSGSTRSGGHKAPRVGSLAVDDDARQPGSLDVCRRATCTGVPSAGPGSCAARPAAGAAGLPSRRAFPVERRGWHLGVPGGAIHQGKTPEATARRKAQEEIWPVPAYHVTRTQGRTAGEAGSSTPIFLAWPSTASRWPRPAGAGRGHDGAAALAGTHLPAQLAAWLRLRVFIRSGRRRSGPAALGRPGSTVVHAQQAGWVMK